LRKNSCLTTSHSIALFTQGAYLSRPIEAGSCDRQK
jgi:hypothetical protein